MKVLHLPLKKQWFDLIESGDKPEEYREITNHWIDRLCWHEFHDRTANEIIQIGDRAVKKLFFDAVRFVNGYGNHRPQHLRMCMTITIDFGKEKWGAEPGKKYFVIKLGEQIPL